MSIQRLTNISHHEYNIDADITTILNLSDHNNKTQFDNLHQIKQGKLYKVITS